MKYNPYYYRLDLIPEHRLQIIDIRIQQIISDYNIKKWPINTVKLIRHIKKKGLINLDYMTIPGLSENFDAVARYFTTIDCYLIQINEDKTKRYPWISSRDRRLNFTIAHELGHIFLDHLLIPNNLKTTNQIMIEDEEANEFAGRLLMPADLLLKCNFVSEYQVAKHFNVSEQALWKRLNHLKRLDLLTPSSILDVCGVCSNKDLFPKRADYCPTCGEKLINLTTRGVMPMLYDGYILNQINGKAKNCPNCDNEDMGDDGSWCRICGNIVVNKCTNQFCEIIAFGNSRHCEMCGEKTTFFEAGYLLEWQETKKMIEAQEDPFDIGQINLKDIEVVDNDDIIPF